MKLKDSDFDTIKLRRRLVTILTLFTRRSTSLLKGLARKVSFTGENGVSNKDLRANHCKVQLCLTGSVIEI